MIGIVIDKGQKDEIERIYRCWFNKYLKPFKETINKDEKLKKIIFGENEYNEEDLFNFLLMDTESLKVVKEKCDTNNTIQLKKETVVYLEKIYKNFRSSQAARIVEKLKILSYPYCNQNGLITYKKNGKRKFAGELDHFYNKSKYPELMICLYNLIPSCGVCNRLKKEKNEKIINPYDILYKSNITFKTTFDDECKLDYLFGKSDHFKIEIDKNKLSDEDLNEIDLLHLNERYKQSEDYAQEIILKSMAYDPIYTEKISKMFNESSEEKLNQYLYGYRDNHLKRSFSKFNQDIMNEFKGRKE